MQLMKADWRKPKRLRASAGIPRPALMMAGERRNNMGRFDSPVGALEAYWDSRRKPVREPGSWIYIYEDETGPETVYSFDMEDSAGNALCTGDLTQGYDNANFCEQVARTFCIPGEPVYVSMPTISPADIPDEYDMLGRKVTGARNLRMHMEIDQHDDR